MAEMGIAGLVALSWKLAETYRNAPLGRNAVTILPGDPDTHEVYVCVWAGPHIQVRVPFTAEEAGKLGVEGCLKKVADRAEAETIEDLEADMSTEMPSRPNGNTP